MIKLNKNREIFINGVYLQIFFHFVSLLRFAIKENTTLSHKLQKVQLTEHILFFDLVMLIQLPRRHLAARCCKIHPKQSIGDLSWA